jgi:hypothetical protein
MGTERKRDLEANLGKGQLLMKSAEFPLYVFLIYSSSSPRN